MSFSAKVVSNLIKIFVTIFAISCFLLGVAPTTEIIEISLFIIAIFLPIDASSIINTISKNRQSIQQQKIQGEVQMQTEQHNYEVKRLEFISKLKAITPKLDELDIEHDDSIKEESHIKDDDLDLKF